VVVFSRAEEGLGGKSLWSKEMVGWGLVLKHSRGWGGSF
jgi:hypothetical protein